MKTIYLLLIVLILVPSSLWGQKVFKVEYESQADEDGLWYFVKYDSQADKKIYFVDYESQADLKIFKVKYESQAGWNKTEKQHLLL